ncbi:MAG: HAMP domain-containing sensor histidine kinase [Rubripirellula sp.]|nr:HAMP domain-containing sensor histidine kinase [Rubripirellula sp.]
MSSPVSSINGFIVDPDLKYGQDLRASLARDHNPSINLECCKTTSQCKDGLRQSKGALVLLGMDSIETNDLDAISRVRAMNSTITILVLVNRYDEFAAVQCVARGAQDCLFKQGLGAEALRQAIVMSLRRQRVVRDLTSRHASLADQLARHDERRQQNQRFIRTVSHDFRTPLTVISEFASLLQEGLVGESTLDGKQQHFLRVISDRSNELNTMVGNLLDATKLESHCLPLWRKPFGLADAIAMLESNLRNKAAVKQVALSVDVDQKLPQVFADKDSVQRILNNLLAYAIHSCDTGGIVRFAAVKGKAGKDLVISISNTQETIDPDLETWLAESLSRQIPLSSCKGHALSLKIASELTLLNLGELQAEVLPGCGVELKLAIPLVHADVIAKRFKQRLAKNNPVAIAEIRNVDDRCDCDDEINALLNLALKPNDLLIQVSQGRSRLLIPAEEEASCLEDLISAYRNRFEEVLADVNQRRGNEKLAIRLEFELLNQVTDEGNYEPANPTPIGLLNGSPESPLQFAAAGNHESVVTNPNCTI